MKAIKLAYGQTITAQVAVEPGVYPLGGDKAGPVLTITLSDAFLDLSGVALIGVHHEPHRFKGVGILLKGCKGLRLSGVTAARYHRGIVLEDCEDVTLVDCHADHNGCHRFYSTEEKYDKRDFLNIFEYKVWSKYGAGIYLSRCKRCTIHRASACNQLNGIILDQCDECLVQGCECTDNLGWGVRLYRSSHNRIVGNDLSHCISGETPHYSVGNDSTGICICHACHFNVIADNDLRYGGDGFFLTADLGTEQSNDNLIIGAQSGSQRILDACRRGHSVADVVYAVRLTRQHGLTPVVDFIFGLPGECEEDERATLELIHELADLGASIRGHTFTPLPQTPFAGAPAGRVSPKVRAVLGQLHREGRVTGLWWRQER